MPAYPCQRQRAHPRWDFTLNNAHRLQPDHQFILTVDGVQMRAECPMAHHPHHDSVKLRKYWHSRFSLSPGPGFPRTDCVVEPLPAPGSLGLPPNSALPVPAGKRALSPDKASQRAFKAGHGEQLLRRRAQRKLLRLTVGTVVGFHRGRSLDPAVRVVALRQRQRCPAILARMVPKLAFRIVPDYSSCRAWRASRFSSTFPP